MDGRWKGLTWLWCPVSEMGQRHWLGLQGCENKHNIGESPDVENCSQGQSCERLVGRSWRAPAQPLKGHFAVPSHVFPAQA